MEFVAAAAIDRTKNKENRDEFLLLSELCTGEGADYVFYCAFFSHQEGQSSKPFYAFSVFPLQVLEYIN